MRNEMLCLEKRGCENDDVYVCVVGTEGMKFDDNVFIYRFGDIFCYVNKYSNGKYTFGFKSKEEVITYFLWKVYDNMISTLKKLANIDKRTILNRTFEELLELTRDRVDWPAISDKEKYGVFIKGDDELCERLDARRYSYYIEYLFDDI